MRVFSRRADIPVIPLSTKDMTSRCRDSSASRQMAEYKSSAFITVVLAGQPATRMPDFPVPGNPSLPMIFAQPRDFREPSIDRFGLRGVLFWLLGHDTSRLHLHRPPFVDVFGKLGHEPGRLEDHVDAVPVAREHRVGERDLVLRARDRNVEEPALLLEPIFGDSRAIAREPPLR